VALSARGWRISYLGADTPLADLAGAALRLKPAVVVISATDESRLLDSAADIRRLADHARTVVGGAGATANAARRLRAERLTGDPVTAAASL
jgi:methanogenic corrinoid protein MtbC1